MREHVETWAGRYVSGGSERGRSRGLEWEAGALTGRRNARCDVEGAVRGARGEHAGDAAGSQATAHSQCQHAAYADHDDAEPLRACASSTRNAGVSRQAGRQAGTNARSARHERRASTPPSQATQTRAKDVDSVSGRDRRRQRAVSRRRRAGALLTAPRAARGRETSETPCQARSRPGAQKLQRHKESTRNTLVRRAADRAA